jgi:hypothetical protein
VLNRGPPVESHGHPKEVTIFILTENFNINFLGLSNGIHGLWKNGFKQTCHMCQYEQDSPASDLFCQCPSQFINLSPFVVYPSLKNFLQVGSFYSLDEYYEWKTRNDCAPYR